MENASADRQAQGGNRLRHLLRILQPLFWWLLLVAILFAYRKHEILSEQTRLIFSVRLESRPVEGESIATLDGVGVESGMRIPLGRHDFVVSHPKGEPFATNLFIWYGEHNLGEIDLKRSKGILSVEANPPAALLFIHGPEFNLTLSNSAGMTSSVPSDHYEIEAQYLHSDEKDLVEVPPHSNAVLRLTPQLGALELSCNQRDAAYQVFGLNVQVIEAGRFPSTIPELPEGAYKLVSEHHGNRLERRVSIHAGVTNNLNVEFLYGAAAFDTEPSGASVYGADGRQRGVTPLQLIEISQGTNQFALRKDGYESVSLSLIIRANETNSIRTNLVNASYLGSMNAARRFLAAGEFVEAFQSASDALRVQAGDSAATDIQKEAAGRGHLRTGVERGKQGDYRKAVAEVKLALEFLPQNEEAEARLAEFEKREQEQNEERQKKRLERIRGAFDSLLARHPDSVLFDSHELSAGKKAGGVHAAILRALTAAQPGQSAFKVTAQGSLDGHVFQIVAEQPLLSLLGQVGLRKCLIVGGPAGEDHTQILYKVLEYKVRNRLGVSGLFKVGETAELVPIHPSRIGEMTDKLRAQINEGFATLNARIVQGTNRD